METTQTLVYTCLLFQGGAFNHSPDSLVLQQVHPLYKQNFGHSGVNHYRIYFGPGVHLSMPSK